ncbi:centrosome and spindle pole associated protein 1-like isoform X2 [Salarias fasciatus]|uniref:centrosome and spindle pole associated protein 1-like isoform X2 n=1 Tax=Salarias fasciatus TaxID=181472 RepID=UPI001176A323|nr:centrosome and spindle pole associated protein 1-like isoform X2 [Salarias fasciatus]
MAVGSLRVEMDDELEKFLKERKARVAEDKASLSHDPPYMEMKAKPDRGYVSKENIPPRSATQGREESCSVGLPLGVEYERKKQRLQKELRMDYRRFVAQKHFEPVKPRPLSHLSNGVSVESGQRDAATLTEDRSASDGPLRLLHPESEEEEEEELEPAAGRRFRHVGVDTESDRRPTAGMESRDRRVIPSGTATDGRRSRALSRNEEAEFATGLIIGAADPDELIQRRKDRYRKELQEQIAEQHRNRKREKDLELKVAATGANDPEKQPDRIRQFGLSRRRELHGSEPAADGERPPPRSAALAVRERDAPPPDQPHVAFQSPLLEYSSALGLGGLGAPGGLGAGRLSSNSHAVPPSFPSVMDIHRTPLFAPHPPSSLSEAYRSPYAEPQLFYGSRGLLEPSAACYGHLSVPGVPGVPGAGLPVSYWTCPPGGAVPGQFGPHSPHSQLSGSSFPEPQLLLNADAVVDSHVRSLAPDVPRSSRERIHSYRDALKQQIQEQQERRRREREERERYEAQLEADMRKYQPWGRGGGGAPLRDSTGNLITDLNQMHKLNEEAYSNPEQWQRRAAAPAGPRAEPTDPNDRVSGFAHVPTSQFARGKVFSSQPSKQQLHERNMYKAYLSQQIEDKMRKKAEERERERLEEEKEERRLAEQRARIQREFEEEQEKKRRKDMEQKAKNEELMQLAEQKKREAERKKKEAEEKENEALRRQYEKERQARVEEVCREPSPPIPTLQKRQRQHRYTPRPPTADSRASAAPPSDRSLSGLQSPPVPARRNQLRAAGDQDSLMGALARLRRHLYDEQTVLEERLEQEEPDSPPSCRRGDRPVMDVFEMARRRLQVPVRRPSARTLEPHRLMRIHDSLQLRFSDEESRPEEEDVSHRKRRDLGDPFQQAGSCRSTVQDDYSDVSPLRQHDYLRTEMGSARGSLLESESAFIDPLEASSLPQTPEEEKSRFLSARERRRMNRQSQQDRASSSRPSQEVKPLSDWPSWSRGRRLVALGQRGHVDAPSGPPGPSDNDSPPPRFSLHLDRQSSGETDDADIWTRPGSSDTFRSFKQP